MSFVWSHAFTTALRLVVISRTTGQCCFDRSCDHIRLIFEYTRRAFKKKLANGSLASEICIKIMHKSESYKISAVQGKISKRWLL